MLLSVLELVGVFGLGETSILLHLLSIEVLEGLTVLPCIILIAVFKAPRHLMTAHMNELQPLIIITCVELATMSSALPRPRDGIGEC